MVIKVRKVGNSLMITIPIEVAERLRLGEGDSVHLIEQPHGYAVTAFDPDFHAAMETWRVISKRYRNALKELA